MLSLGGVVVAPVDDDVLMFGHRDAKLDLEKVSASVTGLRPVDDDATTGNSRTEFFETLHLRSDLGSDLFRWLAIPKGDFDWGLHIEPSHAAAPQEIKCYTSDCAAPCGGSTAPPRADRLSRSET